MNCPNCKEYIPAGVNFDNCPSCNQVLPPDLTSSKPKQVVETVMPSSPMGVSQEREVAQGPVRGPEKEAQSPSAETKPSTIRQLSLASLWWGIGFALVYGVTAISLIFLARGNTSDGSSSRLQVTAWITIAMVSFFSALICLLVCIGNLHSYLGKITRRSYPISAPEAVLFHLIPFFNLYWVIKWPSEVINFVNSYEKGTKRIAWAPGLSMLLGGLGPLFVLGIGFPVWFWVVGHLMKYVRGAVRGMNLPIDAYEHQKSSGGTATLVVAVVIGSIFFVGLLAAIAIPNFLRAKELAQQKQTSISLNRQYQYVRDTAQQEEETRPLKSYYEDFGLVPPESRNR